MALEIFSTTDDKDRTVKFEAEKDTGLISKVTESPALGDLPKEQVTVFEFMEKVKESKTSLTIEQIANIFESEIMGNSAQQTTKLLQSIGVSEENILDAKATLHHAQLSEAAQTVDNRSIVSRSQAISPSADIKR